MPERKGRSPKPGQPVAADFVSEALADLKAMSAAAGCDYEIQKDDLDWLLRRGQAEEDLGWLPTTKPN